MKWLYDLNLPDNFFRLLKLTSSLQGRCGKYVFQNSNGGRQVKRYDPAIYRNYINTPLRKRAREIMKMAMADPGMDLQAKIRELYRTYPYYLLKTKPVGLRLKNFYFRKMVIPQSELLIYCLSGEQPAPEDDELYAALEYSPKKQIEFRFRDKGSEKFYACNPATRQTSNLLHFIWQD